MINTALNNDNTLTALTQTFTEVIGRSQEARISGSSSFLAMLETPRKQSEEQQEQKNTEKQIIEDRILQYKTSQQNELQTRSVRQEELSENEQQHLNRSENVRSDYREKTEIRKNGNSEQSRELPELPVFYSHNSAGSFSSLQTYQPQTAASSNGFLQTEQLPLNNRTLPEMTLSDTLPAQTAASALPVSELQMPVLAHTLTNPVLTGTAASFNSAVNGADSPVYQAAATSLITVFTATGRLINGNAVREKQTEVKSDDKKNKNNESGKTDSKTESGGTAKRSPSSFGAAVFGKFLETPQTDFSQTEPSSGIITGIKLPHLFKKTESENDKSEELPDGLKEHLKALALAALRQASEANTSANPETQTLDTGTTDTQTADTQTAEQYERVLFVQRIAAACQSAAQQNGAVRFRINTGNDETLILIVRNVIQKSGDTKNSDTKNSSIKNSAGITVRFEAASETTAGLLSGSIDSLITTLAEQGTVLTKQGVEIVCRHIPPYVDIQRI